MITTSTTVFGAIMTLFNFKNFATAAPVATIATSSIATSASATDPMKALAAANHLNALAEADRLDGMGEKTPPKVDKKPGSKKFGFFCKQTKPALSSAKPHNARCSAPLQLAAFSK